MEIDRALKIRAYRVVGVTTLSFAVLAILSVCVTLPLVYNYVNHVSLRMNAELRQCTVSRLFFEHAPGFDMINAQR